MDLCLARSSDEPRSVAASTSSEPLDLAIVLQSSCSSRLAGQKTYPVRGEGRLPILRLSAGN
jgi:hypothetical protein